MYIQQIIQNTALKKFDPLCPSEWVSCLGFWSVVFFLMDHNLLVIILIPTTSGLKGILKGSKLFS